MAKLRKTAASIEAAQKIKDQMKRYSLANLGEGNKNGGTVAQKKVRKDVLSRLRGCGGLSAEQEVDFDWFIEEWDRVNAAEHAEDWGLIFQRKCRT